MWFQFGPLFFIFAILAFGLGALRAPDFLSGSPNVEGMALEASAVDIASLEQRQ